MIHKKKSFISNTEKTITAVAFIIVLFWGRYKNNQYQTTQSKTSESTFVINYLKENYPESTKIIDKAKKEYYDLGVDAANENGAEGTIH